MAGPGALTGRGGEHRCTRRLLGVCRARHSDRSSRGCSLLVLRQLQKLARGDVISREGLDSELCPCDTRVMPLSQLQSPMLRGLALAGREALAVQTPAWASPRSSISGPALDLLSGSGFTT